VARLSRRCDGLGIRVFRRARSDESVERLGLPWSLGSWLGVQPACGVISTEVYERVDEVPVEQEVAEQVLRELSDQQLEGLSAATEILSSFVDDLQQRAGR
jgi:hypothetical protein